MDQTKVVGSLDGNDLNFTWQKDDQILVTVPGCDTPAVFTLVGDGGQAEGQFTGTMPADGTTFSVKYPADDPNLSEQNYEANGVPEKKMRFAKENCTIAGFALEPQDAVIRLDLYGTDKTVGKIVVTNTTASPNIAYTLNMPENGVALPSTEADAKPFFVVMPTGTYKFKAEVFDTSSQLIRAYETSEAKEFAVGKFLDMPSKEVTPETPQQTIDLSASETANCYIVSKKGTYKFKTVQGNSNTSVDEIKGVKVLWESFGTSTAPSVGDLIKANISYADNYITFSTNDTFKKGNAVIAAYSDVDCADGNVLWSWHIWLTDLPADQTYNNNAGKMMDRNLGATTAGIREVGSLGLMYQWGRKDPFLGSSSITEASKALSTPSSWGTDTGVDNASDNMVNLRTSIKNPTTFMQKIASNNDWYANKKANQNNTLWSSTKTIYDPCPSGYRVPDGGSNGVWCKAFGTNTDWLDYTFDNGLDFGKTDRKLVGSGSDACWYPAAGYLLSVNGNISVGTLYYWSCTAVSDSSYTVYDFHYQNNYVKVNPQNAQSNRASGLPVRCLKEESKK